MTHDPTQIKTASESPPSSPPLTRAGRVMGRIDVGPIITLPLLRMGGAALVGAVLVGAAGVVAVLMFAPLPKGPWMSAVWLGAAAVVAAHWAGLLAMRPWRGRRLGQWAMIWLLGRAVSFVGVLASAALLYSATHPRPLAFGLAIAAGYFVALLAEVAVYAAHVRSVTGEDASGTSESAAQ